MRMRRMRVAAVVRRWDGAAAAGRALARAGRAVTAGRSTAAEKPATAAESATTASDPATGEPATTGASTTSGPPETAESSASTTVLPRAGKQAVAGRPDGQRPSRRRRSASRRPLSRRRSSKRPKKTGFRRFFTWRKLLAYFFGFWALLLAAFAVLYFSIDIPKANALAKAQSNVYLYSDGTVAARTGEINRESVDLSRVPKVVQRAFVAAENKSFYQDRGVDPVGVARGLLNTVTGKGTQGGSTITQQYVKNYYLSQDQTVTRKVKELVIALKVDQRNSKDDILAGYLNTSYFGRNAYGIQAAARAYYGKEVEKLTVSEGAYLAALVQAPSQYDWAIAGPVSRKLVKQRWNYVLNNMVEVGWLDPGERRRQRFAVPRAPKPTPGLDGQAGYLVDAARRELIASGVSEQDLAAGGWTITLSIDPAKQRALEKAITDRAKSPATQAGAVSVDPRTGKVVAFYGGRDYTRHYINNATRTDYQVGSAFEPLVLAASLEHGDGTEDVPPGRIKQTAADLGMDSKAPGFDAERSTELGLMASSPLELAGVYATLDNHGRKITPSVVASAQRGHERAELPDPVGDHVISRGTADAVTVALAADAVKGNGVPASVRNVPQAVAGAAGRSDDRKAAWFVGYTPELVTAVGLFGEDPKTQKQVRLQGAGGPGDSSHAQIWSAYTQEALRGSRPVRFDLEDGVPVEWAVPSPTG
ncbi:transglycosylase domain-containing protein [Streptomyces sp. SAJ15]|uniref:transglycosylase domain-containing protein n=1 Tax=Streptomyces sp. SAJ15 TaxID=2011095 RepID=UPI0021B2F453|nr:transglycosylase domain-containing protein [Streptomyces sp. SAJ15]